jgi:hypothetical protein
MVPGLDVTVDEDDHNFQPFSPIFGEKLAFFLKTNVTINFLH